MAGKIGRFGFLHMVGKVLGKLSTVKLSDWKVKRKTTQGVGDHTLHTFRMLFISCVLSYMWF